MIGTEHIENFPVRQLHVTNWLILVLFAAMTATFFAPSMARSVFWGGLIANSSFILLHRDMARFFAGGMVRPKIVFFVRYYARLTVLALVIFLLVKNTALNIPGFCLGLSTVVAGILVTTATYACKRKIVHKEAA